jgi:hypothetical protein
MTRVTPRFPPPARGRPLLVAIDEAPDLGDAVVDDRLT